MDSGLTEQVIQIFPEEYQPLLATLAAVAMGLISLGALLWPFISKWASNRQVAAINESALNLDDVNNVMAQQLDNYKKADTIKKIAEWEYKLIYATTQEAKDMCNAEIARLKAELETYA